MDFHTLFENLLKQMNALPFIDFEKIRDPMDELCRYLRIAKTVTTTYGNARLEALGRGDDLVSYDSGKPGVLKMSDRIITDMMSVVVCKVYAIVDSEPWTDEERDRIKLFTDTVGMYVSRTRLLEAADRYAFYDDDGYHNIRYFVKAVNKISQMEGLNGKAALQFNLKHFSLVNQQIGRAAGGFVMLSFYKSIEKMLGDKGIICRMGGDNFVVFTDVSILDELLEYLKGTAIKYDTNSDERIMISATVGVYVIPDDFEFANSGDILDKVIAAFNIAKTGGKDGIAFFSEAMVASKEKINRIQRLFPEAIAKEEFHVFYQPKIDINTGELIGAEALCRWFHEGQLIPPMEFIPILEQGVDICKLDFYMLDHVCRDLRRWLEEGREVVRVSVNLSRKHMMDLDLLDHIIEIVDRNNVPHKYVEVELTETTTDVEFRDLKRVVSGLQMAGISTSVDDFGMGYSSLNLIKEVPWNTLKVDRSFLPIEEDDENSTRSVMFKYVVAMAKELGLECIAEGVETQSQLEVLRQNHCQLAQGFLFDKPLPVMEFEERLAVHRYKM